MPTIVARMLRNSCLSRRSLIQLLESIQAFDEVGPYRPEILRQHVDFENFYKPDAPFPAASEKSATRIAGSPLKKPKQGKQG